MNYIKHYDILVSRAKNRNLDVYTEKHHIIPKCIGGTDDLTNIVELTPEEHYVAHQLLIKMYPDNRKLIHAAVMMTVDNLTNRRRTNKLYGWLRKQHAKAISINQTGNLNSQAGRFWIYNISTGEVKRIKSQDVPYGWIRGKTPNTLCEICQQETGSKQRRFCNEHRPKSIPPVSKMSKGNDTAKKLSDYCKSRTKEEHPQFGKRWIHNHEKQKMVPLAEIEKYLLKGWKKGKLKCL